MFQANFTVLYYVYCTEIDVTLQCSKLISQYCIMCTARKPSQSLKVRSLQQQCISWTWQILQTRNLVTGSISFKRILIQGLTVSLSVTCHWLSPPPHIYCLLPYGDIFGSVYFVGADRNPEARSKLQSTAAWHVTLRNCVLYCYAIQWE